jgi:hypothetical protein
MPKLEMSELGFVKLLRGRFLYGTFHVQPGFMNKSRGSLPAPLAWTECETVGQWLRRLVARVPVCRSLPVRLVSELGEACR